MSEERCGHHGEPLEKPTATVIPEQYRHIDPACRSCFPELFLRPSMREEIQECVNGIVIEMSHGRDNLDFRVVDRYLARINSALRAARPTESWPTGPPKGMICPTCKHPHSGSSLQRPGGYSGCSTCGWCLG